MKLINTHTQHYVLDVDLDAMQNGNIYTNGIMDAPFSVHLVGNDEEPPFRVVQGLVRRYTIPENVELRHISEYIIKYIKENAETLLENFQVVEENGVKKGEWLPELGSEGVYAMSDGEQYWVKELPDTLLDLVDMEDYIEN